LKELKLKRKRETAAVDVTVEQIVALFETLEEKVGKAGNTNYIIENYLKNLHEYGQEKVDLKKIQREAKLRARDVKKRHERGALAMSTIPLHLQRRFEQRWAARFVRPVASVTPKIIVAKGTINCLARPAKKAR